MIRDANLGDVPSLIRLVHALAEFEQSADQVQLTEERLRSVLFGLDPKAHALVADDGGVVVGMAVYFISFSTWTGWPGVYLEDLFVEPAHRRAGWGRRLLAALAGKAVDLGDGRLEWAVLDWNEDAIAFYRSLGAVAMDGWTTFRLAGAPLLTLARGPDGPGWG